MMLFRFLPHIIGSRVHARAAIRLWLVLGLVGASLSLSQAAELLMFERAGCPWCRRWDQEVGKIYPKTPEGQVAPLRRISLDHPLPADIRLNPPVFFTPTFVLMHEEREIARITGYLGDDAFWGMLSKFIAPLRAAPMTKQE
jgi:hypothetical protein